MNKIKFKKLIELAEIITGINAPSSERKKEGNWMLIRGRNIIKNTVLPSDVYIPESLVKKNSKSIIVPGDILLTTHFEQYKIGIVPSNFGTAITDRCVIIIRPKSISKEYLHRFLTSKTGRKAFINQFDRSVRGGVIKFITAKDVKNLEIPLLPEKMFEESIPKLKSTSMIKDLKDQFETEIEKNVILFLEEKGWTRKEIIPQYRLEGNIFADIVLKKNNQLVALIEIKKYDLDFKLALNQIQMMGNLSGINRLFLISGEGFKEVNAEKGIAIDIADLPSPEEFK